MKYFCVTRLLKAGLYTVLWPVKIIMILLKSSIDTIT